MGKPRPGARHTVAGYICLGLLSLQFGIQPILYKTFASKVQHPFTLVFACEICKFLFASIILATSGNLYSNLRTWRLMESLRYSGIPACTYAIQNSLVLVSYQNLPPLLFNLLNQTKLLWTALFVYVLLGKRFSNVQCFSMLLLSVAALSLSQDNEGIPTKEAIFFSVLQVSSPSIRLGVIPILFASILSGLGAALTQRSMQIHSRDTALVTMELSLYGTCFVLLQKFFSSYVQNPALDQTFSFTGWTTSTMLPVLCNAVGGLLVGVVTKLAGGVLKSFALVGGIICTALVDSIAYQKQLSFEMWVAAFLVGVSLMLFSAFPHQNKVIRKTI